MLTTKLVLIKKRHLDIPIPYVLLLYIPLPVIPIPNIPSRKSYLWNMDGVFMLGIPIPDIYITFINNEHNLSSHTLYHTVHSLSHTLCHKLFITFSSLRTLHHTLFITHSSSHTLYHTLFITHSSSHTLITHSLSYTLYHPLFVTHSSSHTLRHTIFIIHFLSHTLFIHSLSQTQSLSHTLQHTHTQCVCLINPSPISASSNCLCNFCQKRIIYGSRVKKSVMMSVC